MRGTLVRAAGFRERWTGSNSRTRGDSIQLGLKRIVQLLPPSDINFHAIHVAGTNGKGTVCFYTAHILRSRGLHVARFTSPHLLDRWDCINIDGKPVSESLFKNIEHFYRSKNEAEGIGASPFEILTATAFDLFNMHKVDVAVVEVGVGGREDATNILPQEKVLCSVITQIGLDHQGLLGHSLVDIARHKAGIIKAGVPCVYDGQAKAEVKKVIVQEAASPSWTPFSWRPRHVKGVFGLVPLASKAPRYAMDESAPLFPVGLESTYRKKPTDGDWIGPFGDHYIPKDFAKPIAIASKTASISLQRMRGPTVHQSSLSACLRGLQWPGRLQSLSLTPLVESRRNPVLLDGAHNVDSAKRLSDFVAHRFRVGQDARAGREAVTWVLAASAGKDTTAMLRELLRSGDTLFTTTFGPVDGMPWVSPTSAQQLLDQARLLGLELGPASGVVSSVRDALERATNAANEGPVIIAGSLYLVSDVLRLCREAYAKPETCWKVWERPVKLDRSLWSSTPAGPSLSERYHSEPSIEDNDDDTKIEDGLNDKLGIGSELSVDTEKREEERRRQTLAPASARDSSL